MITQYEVQSLLSDQIPELAAKAYPSKGSLLIYASINHFTDYTIDLVKNHDLNRAKNCFVIAERLYLNGDNMVRLLIENSFMYTFCAFKGMGRTETLLMKSIIPGTLLALYTKQQFTSRLN